MMIFKLSTIGLIFGSASKHTASASPLTSASSNDGGAFELTCYDYSDILPLDPSLICTQRSVFLEIRQRFMDSRNEVDSEPCPGGLHAELMTLTGTTEIDAAHEVIGHWCDESMEIYNSVVPAVCYDYSDILPLNTTERCTQRSVFLQIRERFMATRDAPDSQHCPGGLDGELKGLTGTTDVEDAHTILGEWCDANMEIYNSVPPPICYNYTGLFELDPKECTQRNLFLHIRKHYMEQRDTPGAQKCAGGLDGELKGLTKTIDVDEAHKKLQELCDSALLAASTEANNDGWGSLESASINLEEFFDGAGFLNDETGNFQQDPNDFIKAGGRDRFTYVGDDPRFNDHYPTSNSSYYGGQAIAKFYSNEAKFSFLTSPTSEFQEGSCSSSQAAVCCWHRDRQYFDNNGNCQFSNCVNREPGDNTDLCWTEDESGDVFPYPGDLTEGDLHCHGFAWAKDEVAPYDINSKAKWNNLFFVSLYDHLYQRGYTDAITDDANIAGEQAMCGCVEDMSPVARADCTEVLGRANYTVFQDGLGGPLVVQAVPGTFYLEFRACQGYDYVDGFGPEDYEEDPNAVELVKSNNDLAAFMFRQYLEGKVDDDKIEVVKNTLIGYTDPTVNDGDEEREVACKAAFEQRFPGNDWVEREIV